MKKLLAIVLLILSFSANQLAFAQVDCFSTGRCRGSWTVVDYGCKFYVHVLRLPTLELPTGLQSLLLL